MAKQRPKIYGITADQAKRIRRTCERVEGTPGRSLGDSAARPAWTPGILRAKVTTKIPGGTFASPSSAGKVQIYELDHNDEWVPSPGDPVEVRNQFGGGSIAVDDGVLVAWIAGQLFVIAADCPPEE